MALSQPTHLIDKSALARARLPEVAAVLSPLFATDRVAATGVLFLEVLFSARNHADLIRTRLRLRGLPRVDLVQADFDRAVDVMEALAQRGLHRAAALPDLIQAAAAERAGLTLLHYDADYDLIATVTGQATEWIVPRGSVP